MPIKQGIIDFYNVAQERDFSRDFMFRILNMANGEDGVGFDDKDLVYIRSGSVPTKSISNQEVPFMGLNFNVPGTMKFEESASWQIKVLCDAKFVVRSKFEAWHDKVFDIDTSTGNLAPRGDAFVLDIGLLNQDMEVEAVYTLFGCYLVKLGALNYDVSSSGKPVEFDATIAYHFWRKKSAS
jgi:hypothetical protein